METLRTRRCVQCEAEFSYAIARGADRRYCSDFCRGRARHRANQSRSLCIVPGCVKPRRYVNPAVCNGCHYRLKRTGTLARREWAYRSRCAQGYIRVFKTTHPLAIGGYVYEHRQVLYDAIGPGPHPCHWCRTDINWVVGRISRGALVPDHVDGDKANNNIDNLVPSCHRCNASRGLFMSWVSKHKDDPFLWMLYQKALGAQAAS